jgi:hypothetical protein
LRQFHTNGRRRLDRACFSCSVCLFILAAAGCKAVLFAISGRGGFLARVVSSPFLSTGSKVRPRGVERETEVRISLFEVRVRIFYYYYFTEGGCSSYGSGSPKGLLMSLLVVVRSQQGSCIVALLQLRYSLPNCVLTLVCSGHLRQNS